MAFDPPGRRLPRSILAIARIGFLGICAAASAAHAEHSTFRYYDASEGLASVGAACLIQDRAGYMLVCTEHGLSAYDGRRFDNLGPEQNLRQGGVVYNLALTSTGRVALGFADEVLVSDYAPDATVAPGALHFRSVRGPGGKFYDDRLHRLAAWRDGLVFLDANLTRRIVVPDQGDPRFEDMGYTQQEQSRLAGAASVFVVRGQLWETFDDRRLCAAEPGHVKCYDSEAGLVGGPWVDVVAGKDGRVLARSATSIATLDPASGRWSVTPLPDQGGRYTNYRSRLGLFTAPDGSLITQADNGLVVLGPSGWHLLTVDDGAPAGTIVNAMTDASGQLWFRVLGRGLVRWVGYGRWETVQKADGLSEGLPWATVRLPDGSLWASTDTGVDQITRQGGSLKVSKVLAGASFAIGVGPRGDLWRGFGEDGGRVFDPATGTERRIAVPPLNAIVQGSDAHVWLATQGGLFSVDDQPDTPLVAELRGKPGQPVLSVTLDGSGGAFYLANGRLHHWRQDGQDLLVDGPWPGGGFEPLALAPDRDGNLWIGGGGGLYHMTIAGDRVTGYDPVSTSDTRTNSIVAVIVDHRGWVWAGTALGISVSDGSRWVSLDAEGGLAADDVDQNGLREDPDGSIWVATSQGLSHLLDPSWVFADHPIKAIVSEARLGERRVTSGTMPYTQAALALQFGTPSYGAERSILFRYRLSGVDSDWAESTSGSVRYAFVPPGRHMLTVVGYDQLTHGTSPPAVLTVKVAYPWWRRWWAELLWLLAAAALAYGAIIWRFRAILARQEELQAHIDMATTQLRHQAAHDSLTGLLNRFEVERRLATALSSGCSTTDSMIVALIDLDHFKDVNDAHGHLCGDEVLRALGGLVADSLLEGEYAGRYGGEEILLVIDNADGFGAGRVMALHESVRSHRFTAPGKRIRVTCSIGLARVVRGDDWESLVGRADHALYKAKAYGRDQVVESGLAVAEVPRIGTGEAGWHDLESGLPNRELFALHLQSALARHDQSPFALLLLEVSNRADGLPSRMQRLADEVLPILAERLQGCARQRDIIARLGDNEFAIIHHGVGDAGDAEKLAVRLIGAMSAPFMVDARRLEIDARIGIAIAPVHGPDQESLLRRADAALFRVKAEGRRGFHIFAPDLDAAMLERRALDRDLLALQPEVDMELLYQPIVSLQPGSDAPAGRVIGFEALLRWNHPARGLLMPGEFIALMEENGAIERVGNWILERACMDAARWRPDLKVAINVSASQFRSGRLVQRLQDVLAESGIRPGRVELEITETTLLPDNEATLETLHQLHACGIHLAIDDFGTGFSSLSYLRSFPFDHLKIDRSFVADMCRNEDSAAIIRAILALGRSLNMTVTAEGVETVEQREWLRMEGCVQAQGYLFGKPVPAQTILRQFARELVETPAQ